MSDQEAREFLIFIGLGAPDLNIIARGINVFRRGPLGGPGKNKKDLNIIEARIRELHYPLWLEGIKTPGIQNERKLKWLEEITEINEVLDEFLKLKEQSLQKIPTYVDHMEVYLELHANRTLNQLTTIPNMDIMMFELLVNDSENAFQKITREKIHLLGRSARHVCIDDTEENRRNFPYLRDLALRFEQEIVEILKLITTNEELAIEKLNNKFKPPG